MSEARLAVAGRLAFLPTKALRVDRAWITRRIEQALAPLQPV